MAIALFLTIFISGLTLSVDAFAVSITDGMVYQNLEMKKAIIIPVAFGVFQAVMPIMGFYISWGLSHIDFIEQVDHWIALALLVFVGGKMIAESVQELKSPEENVNPQSFSICEVMVQGVATSIDALAVGFSFKVMFEGLSNVRLWAWISVCIIGITTFIISLAGLLIGKKVGELFRKKASAVGVIGGIILILIGVKIVLGSYYSLPF